MTERIDARTDWEQESGPARCWLNKHARNGLGRVEERTEMVFIYAPMRNVWVGWRKILKDKGDTLLEKVGEFKEIP